MTLSSGNVKKKASFFINSYFFTNYLHIVDSSVLSTHDLCACVCVLSTPLCHSWMMNVLTVEGSVSQTVWPIAPCLLSLTLSNIPQRVSICRYGQTRTHIHAHVCTNIFPCGYMPLVASRAWFDRERLAPYHVY